MAPVGRLVLTDPTRRNVLSTALVEQAREAHEAFRETGGRVATLLAEGPTFSAGRDPDFTRVPGVAPAGAAFIDEIDSSPLVWVAPVDGLVAGAGIPPMTNCFYVLMTERSTAAVPELDGGIYPRPVGEELASIIGPRKTLDLILSREPLTAHAAAALGLASRVVASDELESSLEEVAASLLALDEPLLSQARTAWKSPLGTRGSGQPI
jgi:enoyl-CoA hydratase/carnithine racemase